MIIETGKKYTLSEPYGDVIVLYRGRVWIGVAPAERETFHDIAGRPQPPARIKRKHWAGKLAA